MWMQGGCTDTPKTMLLYLCLIKTIDQVTSPFLFFKIKNINGVWCFICAGYVCYPLLETVCVTLHAFNQLSFLPNPELFYICLP